MTTASNSALVKPDDRLLDDDRLIGDEMHADADRQFADDLDHLLLQRLAELQQVRAGLHADGKADGRLAVEPEQASVADRRSRGVMVATSVRRKKRSLMRRLIAAGSPLR